MEYPAAAMQDVHAGEEEANPNLNPNPNSDSIPNPKPNPNRVPSLTLTR